MSVNSNKTQPKSHDTLHNHNDTNGKSDLARVFVVVGNLGFVMFFSIIIGFFTGFWLDKFFHTGYILLIAGIIIGICAGFYRCYLILKKELNL